MIYDDDNSMKIYYGYNKKGKKICEEQMECNHFFYIVQNNLPPEKDKLFLNPAV